MRCSRFQHLPALVFSMFGEMVKPAEIAEFGHADHRGDEADTVHRLEGINHGAIDQVGTISTNAASRRFNCSAAPLAG